MAETSEHRPAIQFSVDWAEPDVQLVVGPLPVPAGTRPELVGRAVWGHLLAMAADAAAPPLDRAARIALTWPGAGGSTTTLEFRPAEAESLAALEYQLVWEVARTLERQPLV